MADDTNRRSSLNVPRKRKRENEKCDEEWNKWTIDDLYEALKNEELSIQADIFKKEEINGALLAEITEVGVSNILKDRPYGEVCKVMMFLNKLGCKFISLDSLDCKVFNDPIHGHIEIHPLCMKLIDTHQFQRLRYIKQLGGAYYVFPGASHNRFEHSIGVCHLAGKMVTRLQRQQPELDITNVDVLCVKIAALCHDLGHGPFSHLFDKSFIPLVEDESTWKHEQASVLMLRHLITENHLEKELEKYGILDHDIQFIEEQIAGKNPDKYEGRKDKKYLYEIVSNKRNSIDVDKWDYFARDCHMLGIKNNFDHNRLMRFIRVIKDDKGEEQICFRDKEVENVYDMFHTRKTLHSRAYQHTVSQSIEAMITDALKIANDSKTFRIVGKGGQLLKIQECKDDMVAYEKLDDTILQKIMWSSEKELEEAQNIITRIEKRQLYRCIGSTRGSALLGDENEILKAIAGEKLEAKSLILMNARFDYCMKDKDPVEEVRFYSKSNPDKCKLLPKDQVSSFLPNKFQEVVPRIFCKDHDANKIDTAKTEFIRWCMENKLEPLTERYLSTPAKSIDMSRSSSPNSVEKAKRVLSI